jgi:hypothetical protein
MSPPVAAPLSVSAPSWDDSPFLTEEQIFAMTYPRIR